MLKTIDFQYQCLLKSVLLTGEWSQTRGTSYKYLFNYSFQHDLRNSFPSLSLRNVYPHGAIDEAANDIADAPFKLSNLKSKGLARAWAPFANEHGIIPNTYGRSMRAYPASTQSADCEYEGRQNTDQPIDQLGRVYQELLVNPTSRNLVVQIHNPNSTNSQPTCQTSFVLSSNGEFLDGLVLMRSSDIMFGFLGDIQRYAVIIHVLAHLTGLKARYLAATLVNGHIYEADYNDAKRIAYSTYIPETAPQFEITKANTDFEFEYTLTGYSPDKAFKLTSKEITTGDTDAYDIA